MATVKLGKQEKPIIKRDRTKSHQEYWLKDGTQVTGASTIAKWADQKEGLVYWGHKMGREGRDLNRVREEAADIGACCHFMIECFVKGGEPDLSEFTGKVIGIARKAYGNFTEFWDRSGFRPYKSELELVSERYRYGGTLDTVAIDPADKKVMLEFKVTSGLFLGNKVQLAGCSRLFSENYPGEPIDRSALIRIPKEENIRVEEKWYLDDMPLYFDVFLAALNLHNKVAAIKKK